MVKDNPCNCNNCSRLGKDCPIDITKYAISKDFNIQVGLKEEIKRIGCLSHPQAQMYLNYDVVKKLKCMKEDQSGWKSEDAYKGAKTAFTRAIDVINGGGKND